MGLLAVSVLMAGLPDLVRSFESRGSRLPSVDFMSLVSVLTIVGFAVLGYVAWTRGGAEREHHREEEERTRDAERRRALPPAPVALPPDTTDRSTGFVPRGPNGNGAAT